MKMTALLVVVALALVTAASLAAQTRTTDPISGAWGQNDVPMLELKFDGKSAVTGTAHWRNGAQDNPAPIAKGTFDAKKSAFRLEGEGKGRDGNTGHFVVEGSVLDGDTIGGTYDFSGEKGNFTFRKLVPQK